MSAEGARSVDEEEQPRRPRRVRSRADPDPRPEPTQAPHDAEADREPDPEPDAEADGPDERAGRRGRPVTAAVAARRAAQQVAEFTGRVPECVVSVERADDGWKVGVEVVETQRIPDTQDVLAIYEVRVDEGGDLLSYRRTRRYARGQLDGRSG